MTSGREPVQRDQARFDTYLGHHGDSVLVPAATVVLLRDGSAGVETLMLRKNSKIAFGGMWVFPGGRIDEEDEVVGRDGEVDDLATAATAAVREAAEEASIDVDPTTLVWFAHWVPPPVMPKRFATYFFAAPLGARSGDVAVDDGEITDHEWMRPADAMGRRDGGEIELAPPTWMTLNRLAGFATVSEALTELDAAKPPFYETHMARTDAGPVAMWAGDAGYEANDPTIKGPRHRLTMVEDGYRFEDTRAVA